MSHNLFTGRDLQDIRERGAEPGEVVAQVEQFKKGFPFYHLERPCTVGDGITRLNPEQIERLCRVHSDAALSGRVMKFVPASGAASRMFKSLLSIRERLREGKEAGLGGPSGEVDADTRDFLGFVKGIESLGLFKALKSSMEKDGLDLNAALACGRYKIVIEYALTSRGLNLAELPKGLVPFHSYDRHVRTAFEEHLAEAPHYARDRNGLVRIHFTLSPEHRPLVIRHLAEVRGLYEGKGTTYELTFSEQSPSTDTIAVDMQNDPFRDQEGRLVFRPGGHGALLRNLADLGGDIVFIKNIDNVVPDRLKGDTITYKQALGGYLAELQGIIFGYVERLTDGERDARLINEIDDFLRHCFPLFTPGDPGRLSGEEGADFLLSRLNRPFRVCGMVRNEGEPGGGPFWVRHPDGSLTPQIVESSQVDMKSGSQRSIWESSTHFNPVDLVCGVKDHRGRPFNLTEFTDPDTGFISIKSKDGKELKALELPGLWNGAMARWNTLFVEVPSSTFNPVKTVLDLLRPAHQPG